MRFNPWRRSILNRVSLSAQAATRAAVVRGITSAAALAVAVSTGALAQDARRAARIDVDNYSIRAQVNPETQSLTARATVRFTPLDDQTSSLVFELNNALSV